MSLRTGLVGIAVLMVACTSSEPSSTSAPSGTVSVSQLHAEVAPAVQRTLNSHGLEALQFTTYDDGSVDLLWIDYRSGGDFVAVEGASEDLEALSAVVAVRGEVLMAGPATAGLWERGEDIDPLSLLIKSPRSMVEESYFIEAAELTFDPEVTRSEDSGGSVELSITGENPDWVLTERWEIGPSGHLVGYTYEREVIPMPQAPESEPPELQPEMVEVQFSLSPDPAAILLPEPGEPMDLSVFDPPGIFTG